MKRFPMLAGPLAVGCMVSSCSFPAPDFLEGTITSLWVGGYVGVNAPITIRAKATFPGAVDHPSLTTVLSAQSGNTIRVMATASRAQHFLGLGIFPIDASGPNVTEVETTVTVSSPGAYVVEGVKDGSVTASSSLRI